MRISSQLLLTFLLNACWQVALIAALASLGSWLLRNSVARYRHWIWVSALVSRVLRSGIHLNADTARHCNSIKLTSAVPFVTESISPLSQEYVPNLSGTQTALPSTFQLNQTVGLRYSRSILRFFSIASSNWSRPGKRREALSAHAVEFEPNDRVAAIIRVVSSNSALAQVRSECFARRRCRFPSRSDSFIQSLFCRSRFCAKAISIYSLPRSDTSSFMSRVAITCST
jgi:hypothetical protein